MNSIRDPLPKVKEIVCEILDISPGDLTETSLFKEEHGADSLQMFELLAALEQELGVTIPDAELPAMVNLASIARLLETFRVASA